MNRVPRLLMGLAALGIASSLTGFLDPLPPALRGANSRKPEPRAGKGDPWQEAQVDKLFASWSHEGSPGAAVVVIQDGRVVLEKEYGWAHIEKKNPIPIRRDTRFRLASLTKQFTAMGIMILAERGKLDYHDPLSKFFPEFRGCAGAITVEQLLHHTSGLPDYIHLFLKEKKIDRNWPRSSCSKPSPFEPTAKDTLALLVRHQKELLFLPGQRWKYSNSGYVVLGQILEKVSHQCYAQFLKKEIFYKAGMNHSVVYDETRPDIPQRARSYRKTKEGFEEIDYSPLNLIYGDDGIYTTIEDMVQWDRALEPGKLVGFWSLKRAFSPGILNSGKVSPDRYGYGWGVGEEDVFHAGGWLGFQTYIIRYPGRHFTVVVLANCANLDANQYGDRVAEIYLEGK